MKRLFTLLFLAGLAVPAASFAASDGAARGLAIAQESERRDAGWRDSTVAVTMILQDRRGQTRERKLRLSMQEKPGNAGDKTLTVFDSPPDMAGTLFLSHSVVGADDKLWLYLPSLKRVKRISSVNKSGPFVGSEFAFEDFTALELNKYTYKYLRTEDLDGRKCDVVERYPRYEHSGYTKQISWIDQKDAQVRKVTFYDRRGDLLKTLTLEDYKLYDGKFWRTHTMKMVNHKTGKSTDLVYSDYQFSAGLKDGDFAKNMLNRLR